MSFPPIPEKKDATEENLLEAIESLNNEIKSADVLIMATGMEEIVKSAKGRLTTKILVLDQIYSDMKSEEAKRHEKEYRAKKKEGMEAAVSEGCLKMVLRPVHLCTCGNSYKGHLDLWLSAVHPHPRNVTSVRP